MEMVLTDVQLLSMVICGVLSLIAYRVRIPSLAIIPCAGFFILGFQVYSASEDLLVLGLFIMLAITQFVICFRSGSRR